MPAPYLSGMFPDEKPKRMSLLDCTMLRAQHLSLYYLFVVKRIACFYEGRAPETLWLFYIKDKDGDAGSRIIAKYLFANCTAPLFIRQLFATGDYHIRSEHEYGWYMSNDVPQLTVTFCQNIYNTLDDLTDPKISERGLRIGARDFPLVEELYGLGESGSMYAERDLCARVIAELHRPWAKPRIGAFMAVLHWRNFAKGARRRAHARTDLLREELAAAAWHPRRFADWCLDCEERAELAELFAKK